MMSAPAAAMASMMLVVPSACGSPIVTYGMRALRRRSRKAAKAASIRLMVPHGGLGVCGALGGGLAHRRLWKGGLAPPLAQAREGSVDSAHGARWRLAAEAAALPPEEAAPGLGRLGAGFMLLPCARRD